MVLSFLLSSTDLVPQPTTENDNAAAKNSDNIFFIY